MVMASSVLHSKEKHMGRRNHTFLVLVILRGKHMIQAELERLEQEVRILEFEGKEVPGSRSFSQRF